MTINTSTIEAGDTVVLRNGSRMVADLHEEKLLMLGYYIYAWNKNGSWTGCRRNLYDIIEIIKRPEDVETISYFAYKKDVLFEAHYILEPVKRLVKDAAGYVKITLNHTTKQHSIEEVA